jgi:hypothetical protein
MKNPACLIGYALPAGLLALALGCGPDGGVVDPATRSGESRPSLASARYSAWSSPTSIAGVNSALTDQHPALSKDGLTLYFASNQADGGDLDIYIAQRDCVECSWRTPVALGLSFNSSDLDAAPTLSRDGHQLYFASQRPNGHCSTTPCDRDLWVSYRNDVRADSGWLPPVNLGPPVNTAGEEVAPSFFENKDAGLPQLFFNDGTVNPITGVLGGGNILVSQMELNGSWGTPFFVDEPADDQGINTRSTDQRPSISNDGLELYFFSNRPAGGLSTARLWVATRESVNDPWSSPTLVPIGDNVTTTQPFIHSLGRTQTLLFVRMVPDSGNNLFMSTRTRGAE